MIQTVHTHRASVQQAAKLVAALLRVARVPAGLAESNGSLHTAGFMTHVTWRLTAKNRDQLRNPTLGDRVWATFTFSQVHAVRPTSRGKRALVNTETEVGVGESVGFDDFDEHPHQHVLLLLQLLVQAQLLLLLQLLGAHVELLHNNPRIATIYNLVTICNVM